MRRIKRTNKEKLNIHIHRRARIYEQIGVEEVRIDGKGRLFVRPAPGSEQLFELVYRAAMGVHWDEESESFVTPAPEDLSYVQWFEKVVAAVRDEYGRELVLDGSTRWNMPPGVRQAIEAAFEESSTAPGAAEGSAPNANRQETDMSAYFVVTYDVTDADGYADYPSQVVPLLRKHNAEILVADYEPRAIEGEQRGVTVVLRFESEEAAMNWYNDPEYAPVKQLRIDTTANTTGHLVKGFVTPSE